MIFFSKKKIKGNDDQSSGNLIILRRVRRFFVKSRKVSPGIPQSVTGSAAQFRKVSPDGECPIPQSVTGNPTKCHWLRRPIPQSVTGWRVPNSAKCHREFHKVSP
ncbi:hypothetical protein, partial [Deinococcus sp.]|uniref:hypothetical protein n=1 Tax=Deinococcus sp. TaxID=47478 RepID=UPI003919548F